MSKGHSTIVPTGRGISIDELNHICQAAEGFRKHDDSEPEITAAVLACPVGKAGDMSKPSRRPNREEIKQKRRHRRKQQCDLRAQQAAAGLIPRRSPAVPNATSSLSSVSEEEDVRLEAVAGQTRILKQQLPKLFKDLEKIPNPRNPRKTKHKLTVLMLYGLLMFMFQFASRRAVNKEMTLPQFKENLRLLFPELEDLPHADTLFRLLRDIEVEKIEQAYIEHVRRLIRGKKFRRYLINKCFPIAIDGSQKAVGDTLWEPELLQRTTGKDENVHTQYHAYVLEANLAPDPHQSQNGCCFPNFILAGLSEYGYASALPGACQRAGIAVWCARNHRMPRRIKERLGRPGFVTMDVKNRPLGNNHSQM